MPRWALLLALLAPRPETAELGYRCKCFFKLTRTCSTSAAVHTTTHTGHDNVIDSILQALYATGLYSDHSAVVQAAVQPLAPELAQVLAQVLAGQRARKAA
jgi:hypothetical protein